MSDDSDALAAKAEDALTMQGDFAYANQQAPLVAIAWALLALYERLGTILYVRDADRA